MGIIRTTEICQACGRCQTLCPVGAIKGSGWTKRQIDDARCLHCGQCLIHCPNGAMVDGSWISAVKSALADTKKVVAVQVAPSVRVALGELFGFAPGTVVTNKIFAALRKLGFREVYDTLFGADLTIMEEATELLERLQGSRDPLPQFTSCCPGWVTYVETRAHEMIPHLSTAKSPNQMLGAMIKTYIAQKKGIDPARLFTVSIMPCTAKKYECQRPEMRSSGFTDVDAVLTTRDLARMIKDSNIQFADLQDESADSLGGAWSGGAAIFGTTGGVTEAALRVLYEKVTGKVLGKVDFSPVDQAGSIRSAALDLGGTAVRAAVVYGIPSASVVVDQVLAGKSPYHFIEVMTCPGGCVNGGGQPIYKEES